MLASLKRTIKRVIEDVASPVLLPIRQKNAGPDAGTQILLSSFYQSLAASGNPLPCIRNVGFKCFSQTDEDGILLFLLSMIGAKKKLCVEICAGDGIECNSANLILNHGWHGLLVDGDSNNVAQGIRFFSRSRYTSVYPPRFVCSWITKSSVNDLIAENGFSGEIDLLSIDVDGVDYWIWEAIKAIDPRVVVLEYNDILGPDRSCTVPYSDQFRCSDYPMTGGMPNFAGASLPAFVKLGMKKGYRLVGINRYGYNAFFVRNDLGIGTVPTLDVSECFSHPKVVWGMRERFPQVKDLPWVDV